METTAASRYVRRLLARVRAFDTARPGVWDATVTAMWTVSALVDATGGGWRTTSADATVPTWLVVVLDLALVLPLYWRRRHPMAVLAAMAVAALVSGASGALLQAGYMQLFPVFHIALTRPPRALLSAAALLAPPLAVASIRFPTGYGSTGEGGWDLLVVPYLWAFALASLAGITVRSRREERVQEVERAAAAERDRIAREMHDIIGHNLSVITGLADGGRYAAAKRPEQAAQALDAIATTSRQALAELRRVLRALDPEAVRSPQPGLADLPALIDGVRAAGLPVESEISAAPTLTPGAQLTVYRIVQEALTNALKHAGPDARTTVTLAHAPAATVATITSTTPAPASPAPTAGQGQGIAGMRERAALYDGTLVCGPLPDGTGWRVRLRLPREDSPS
ncbi:two-component sensor kinase [Streptomyces laurentii]|uniref:histidine kinase n=1 Tax=Streptomyces laurentii TaxID=39478 RepID=A0A160P2Z1_STRLU|nr:two-component sensor kinase [Streptomyces laurentii]